MKKYLRYASGTIRMQKIRIKYPKLILLILSFVAAYFVFREANISSVEKILSSAGYAGSFVSGMMFAYGFTAALGTALLLILGRSQNIFLTAIFAGLGSLFADLILLKFIKTSFADEIEDFKNENFVSKVKERIPEKIGKYLTLLLAGIIISSPLPDEIGVALLASSSEISYKIFSLMSFVLNSAGIFVVLLIGRAI